MEMSKVSTDAKGTLNSLRDEPIKNKILEIKTKKKKRKADKFPNFSFNWEMINIQKKKGKNKILIK